MAGELVARGIAVHQHGLAHANNEPEGRKHEFGPSRSYEEQRRDIESGRALLRERLDGVLEPIFTPPWNRCTRDTALCLAELGFAEMDDAVMDRAGELLALLAGHERVTARPMMALV